jgi:hypothetical protein
MDPTYNHNKESKASLNKISIHISNLQKTFSYNKYIDACRQCFGPKFSVREKDTMEKRLDCIQNVQEPTVKTLSRR